MPKQQEIFTTVAIERHSYERLLAVLQNVFTIIVLCVSEGVENSFRRNCIQVRQRRKEEAEANSSVWDLK